MSAAQMVCCLNELCTCWVGEPVEDEPDIDLGSGVVGRVWEGEGTKKGPGEVDYKEEGECELQYVTFGHASFNTPWMG